MTRVLSWAGPDVWQGYKVTIDPVHRLGSDDRKRYNIYLYAGSYTDGSKYQGQILGPNQNCDDWRVNLRQWALPMELDGWRFETFHDAQAAVVKALINCARNPLRFPRRQMHLQGADKPLRPLEGRLTPQYLRDAMPRDYVYLRGMKITLDGIRYVYRPPISQDPTRRNEWQFQVWAGHRPLGFLKKPLQPTALTKDRLTPDMALTEWLGWTNQWEGDRWFTLPSYTKMLNARLTTERQTFYELATYRDEYIDAKKFFYRYADMPDPHFMAICLENKHGPYAEERTLLMHEGYEIQGVQHYATNRTPDLTRAAESSLYVTLRGAEIPQRQRISFYVVQKGPKLNRGSNAQTEGRVDIALDGKHIAVLAPIDWDVKNTDGTKRPLQKGPLSENTVMELISLLLMDLPDSQGFNAIRDMCQKREWATLNEWRERFHNAATVESQVYYKGLIHRGRATDPQIRFAQEETNHIAIINPTRKQHYASERYLDLEDTIQEDAVTMWGAHTFTRSDNNFWNLPTRGPLAWLDGAIS